MLIRHVDVGANFAAAAEARSKRQANAPPPARQPGDEEKDNIEDNAPRVKLVGEWGVILSAPVWAAEALLLRYEAASLPSAHHD